MPKTLKVYKASAGSGKTFTLAVEYIKLLVLRPDEYKFILAVTFTNKATAEMKNRILSTLYGIAYNLAETNDYLNAIKEDDDIKKLNLTDEKIRDNCARALHLIAHDYSHFRIETIDSFFQSVIRDLTRELDLTANLRIDLSADEVLQDAVNGIIDEIKDNKELFTSILHFVEDKIQEGLDWQINHEVCTFGQNIYKEDYLRNQEAITRSTESSTRLREYSRALLKLKEEAKQQLMRMAEAFDTIATDHHLNADSIKYFGNLDGWIKKSKRGEIVPVSQRLEDFMDSTKNWLKKDKSVEPLIEEQLRPLLNQMYRKAQPDASFKINTINAITHHINHLILLNSINIKVRELNREANRFLLADSAHFLNEIIDGSDIPFVYEKSGTFFHHIMIDEFQDTSALQWENFKPLISNSMANQQSCLIVGDVKQSIYRWRDSDWQILNKKIADDYRKYYEPKDLDTNYRSTERVIRFNDQFFLNAKQVVNDDYKASYGVYSDDLSKAYEKVELQKVAKKNMGSGYVSIQNCESQDYIMLTPQLVLDTVKDLHAKGVSYNDMTILVRVNNHIPILCQYFNEHQDEIGTSIVSDEAFRLDSSDAVNLIIYALTAIATPTNRFALCNLAVHYQMALADDPSIKNDVNRFFLSSDAELEALLPDGFMKNTEAYSYTPLLELIEQLYEVLHLSNIPDQDAYLFFFHDKITEYLADHHTDIDNFLQFWNDKMHSMTIPNGASDGIKIMSIHKSKGLEFHTVIVPYCNWATTGKYSNLLWCETNTSPYDELPYTPVNFEKSLDDSIFQSQYREEVLKNNVDNLNLIYVAFTRASKNLVILTGGQQKKSDSISNIQQVILRSIPTDLLEREDDDTLTTWTWGEVIPSQEKQDEEKENILERRFKDITTQFVHKESNIEFRQSNDSSRFIQEESDDATPAPSTDYMEIGNLYHLVFSRIRTIDQVDDIIDDLDCRGCFETVLSVDEARTNIKKALENPVAREWYDAKWEEFNECEILSIKDGILHEDRPDRVITDGKQTIVIDYKSGQLHSKKYVAQVRKYMNLLQSMGYPGIKGYIWYFMEDNIQEVKQQKGGKS